MRFECGTIAVMNDQFTGGPLFNRAAVVHEAHRFDEIEHCPAHGTGVHAQPAADGARDSFEKLEAGEAVAFGFNGGLLQPGTGAASQTLALNFNPGEERLGQANNDAAKTAISDEQI